MREVIAGMQTGNQRAQLAFDIFVHRLSAGLGSMLAALTAPTPSPLPAASARIRPKYAPTPASNFHYGLDP